MFEIIEMFQGTTEGRKFIAKNEDHAQRMIARLKSQLPTGSSTYYRARLV